jgi:hypothetical protein
MKTLLKCVVAVWAVAGTWSAVAQSASAPAKVGVSASDAAVAEKKAVPKADVGTVVRTGPAATDKAKSMTRDKNAAGTRPKKAHPAASGASRPAKAD